MKFIVDVKMPDDVSTRVMKTYITTAIRMWRKGGDPDDPLWKSIRDKDFIVKDSCVHITRVDAVAIVNNHLDHGTRQSKSCWHYGRVEIKELLDAIYGKPKGLEDAIKAK